MDQAQLCVKCSHLRSGGGGNRFARNTKNEMRNLRGLSHGGSGDLEFRK
jgi:hypothetical protein